MDNNPIRQTIRIHFKSIGVRFENKVFAFDPTAGVVGVRFKFRGLTLKGWLFSGITPEQWKEFCLNVNKENTRLAYWYKKFGAPASVMATITFMGIWDSQTTQVPFPFMEMGNGRRAA